MKCPHIKRNEWVDLLQNTAYHEMDLNEKAKLSGNHHLRKSRSNLPELEI